MSVIPSPPPQAASVSYVVPVVRKPARINRLALLGGLCIIGGSLLPWARLMANPSYRVIFPNQSYRSSAPTEILSGGVLLLILVGIAHWRSYRAIPLLLGLGASAVGVRALVATLIWERWAMYNNVHHITKERRLRLAYFQFDSGLALILFGASLIVAAVAYGAWRQQEYTAPLREI
jgi:hypothetical protein